MSKIQPKPSALESLTAQLAQLAASPDVQWEDWGGSLDVRVNVPVGYTAEEWFDLYWGDASYDTEHRGQWAYGSLPQGASPEECREVARELLKRFF